MSSRKNGGKEKGFSDSCQKYEKDVVKKTKKIWILKTLYGKHLLIFRNTWYSNLKILYVSTSYIFVLEAVPLIGLPIVTWTIRACWIWICGFSFWDGISIATSSVASCLNGNDGLFRFIFFVDKYSLFKFLQTSEEMKIFGFFWIAIGRNRAQAPTCVKNCQTSKLYSGCVSTAHQTDLFHRRPNNLFPSFLRVYMVCEHPLDYD